MAGYVLSPEDGRKIKAMWAWFQSAERRRRPATQRRNVAGGGGKCKSSWRIWIQSSFRPQTGNFDLSVSSYNASEELSSATVTVEWDDTAAEVRTKLRAIANLGDAEDESDDQFVVTGGPLPGTSIVITNANMAGRRIISIVDSTSNLTRGVPQVDPSISEADS